MCEEVQNPSVQVPKAMVATIFINTFAGLLFIVPLMFVLPDLQEVILSAQPVPFIIKSAVGSSGGAFGLLFPLIILAIICGIGCTTATSRCTWAFARDGAIPGAKWWAKVNTSLDVPLNAMMLSMVVQIVLGLIYFGSSAAFNAFSGVGVIALTASYATPIAISLATGRKQVQTGKFYLGKFGAAANVIAIGMFSFVLSILLIYHANFFSLVSSRYASLLHALRRPRHRRNRQLRTRRLRLRMLGFRNLVLGLGPQELRWSPYPRGLKSCF